MEQGNNQVVVNWILVLLALFLFYLISPLLVYAFFEFTGLKQWESSFQYVYLPLLWLLELLGIADDYATILRYCAGLLGL